MKWNDDMYYGNTYDVNKLLSEVAALLCDEAEAYKAAHPDNADSIEDIVAERMSLAESALDERLNQQITVRGYGE